MISTQTRVQRLSEVSGQLRQYRTAVSLHSHTHHSKENLQFLPYYAQRTPVVSQLFQSALKRYEQRTGTAADFSRAYWTPPVTPSTVLASETSQIEEKLGLAAMVSITDHDTIAAALSLQQRSTAASIPVSLEWTVPFAGNSFHVGAHHLPPARCDEIMTQLSRYTAEPADDMLGDLFSLLDRSSETLLVLNHPCWDIARVGASKHEASLRQFLSRCRPWIHALEINGLRSWRENLQVLRMAEEYDLPVVAGGDRHGCRPNTVLNLSKVDTWGDFVAEIRADRRSDVLILPAYEEPLGLRQLEVASDALRRYPHYPHGQRRFTDRTFADLDGYGWHPLSFYWDGGVPLWLRPVLRVIVGLGSDRIRPILRWLLLLRGDKDLSAWPVDADYDRATASMAKEGVPE